MTHPLSFSEWRLRIKKQSKGGKKQALSLSTQDPFPHLSTPPNNQYPQTPSQSLACTYQTTSSKFA